MRVVLQRVSEASVSVEGKLINSISQGLLLLVGIGREDSPESCRKLANKIAHLRVFEKDQKSMECSALELGLEVLSISQFTLLASLKKGRRPDFFDAMPPADANELYEFFCKELEQLGLHVKKGIFGAHMHVQLENDGPVTIVLDSSEL